MAQPYPQVWRLASGRLVHRRCSADDISHEFLDLVAVAVLSSQGSAAVDNEIFHVAIFRFAKEHVNDAVTAFHALASASRRESGNLRYDIYRGIDDDQEFYVGGALGFAGGLSRAPTHRAIHPFRSGRASEICDPPRYRHGTPIRRCLSRPSPHRQCLTPHTRSRNQSSNLADTDRRRPSISSSMVRI